jgi:hypothetical protein
MYRPPAQAECQCAVIALYEFDAISGSQDQKKVKAKSKHAKGKIWKATPVIRSCFSFCLFIFAFCLLIFCLSPVTASAQDDDDPAPPPLKVLTKEDKTRLDSEGDFKSRTKRAVDLMRNRIDAAEKRNEANDFDGIFRELGYFRAVLDYSLDFLQKQDLKENKSLDNYKRLELCLRSATPRIETIRRELPLRYEEYVRNLLNYIREARTKAIEPLFSDTVLPEEKKNEK